MLRTTHCLGVAIVLASASLAACDSNDLVTPRTNPDVRAASLSITDQTPRPHLSLDVLLEAVTDRQQSDGTVLVGLKEASAVRGVSTDGVELPVVARHAAESALRTSFPTLYVVRGVSREVVSRGPFGVRVDTLKRTYITVRAPIDVGFLRALRSHPNVDYVVPNYWNGVLGGARMAASAMAASAGTDQRSWGVDTVRAPSIWARGNQGQTNVIGVVDSGVDMTRTDQHPDVPSTNFMSLTSDNTDYPDRCWDPWYPCFHEDNLHGTGVLGVAVGQENGVGGIGVAPGWQPYVGSMSARKVFYTDVSGTSRLRQEDFVDGVNSVQTNTSNLRIAVTSAGYETTNEAAFQPLRDAFANSYYQRDVLWFAWAGNTYGAQWRFLPASRRWLQLPRSIARMELSSPQECRPSVLKWSSPPQV